MKYLSNITNQPQQSFTLLSGDYSFEVTLRFSQASASWFMNISGYGKSYNGIRMTCGVPLLSNTNMPIEMLIVDNSENDVDPFKIDDFSNGRCSILFLTPEEVSRLRGVVFDVAG